VSEIADRFGTRHGTGYERPVTPRWIGALLRCQSARAASAAILDQTTSLCRRRRFENIKAGLFLGFRTTMLGSVPT